MERPVTVKKAIAAIKLAADEIPADDFLSYSTILDVHLSYSLEAFPPEEQLQLLEVLGEILDTKEDLARDISWDLISVLLPFLESPHEPTVSAAEKNIKIAAAKGNPREVFIKAVESLSSLSTSSIHSGYASDEDHPTHSGDESEEPNEILKKHLDRQQRKKASKQHLIKKYITLLSALSIVHPRITTKFPSRFLSTELTTLLRVFTKVVEVSDRSEVNSVVKSLLGFVMLVKPELTLPKPSKSIGQRPPLPPRTSIGSTFSPIERRDSEPIVPEEANSPEALLQARLLVSFLSYLLEVYLLRTRRGSIEPHPRPSEHGHQHTHLMPVGISDGGERGLELGWAAAYDGEVTRKGKSKVPGGRTAIDVERAEREQMSDVKPIVSEIVSLCDELGINYTELLKLCTEDQTPTTTEEDSEDTDLPAPKAASEVPISPLGALFLLSHRLTTAPTSPIRIFHEHAMLTRNYLIFNPGQSQPAVIDAVLFLGAQALHDKGLGEIPETVEEFLIYLQNFGVTSATSSSAQSRFLAHQHFSGCLRKHPDEAVRLAWVRDTLEHCPFESLKAAVVGILKDEIIHATFSSSGEDSAPSTPGSANSIFASPLVIEELEKFLFPDMKQVFAGNEQQNWDAFKSLYPTIMATVNLYYFLLLSPATRDRLGVARKENIARIEERYLGPLGKVVQGFKGAEEGQMEVEVLGDLLQRVEGVKAKVE
ncbi:YAP1-binding protein 1 [Rhizina undulata]